MTARHPIRHALQILRAALADRRGVTILEYGLILAVTSLVILAVAGLMGNESIENLNAIKDSISGAGGQD